MKWMEVSSLTFTVKSSEKGNVTKPVKIQEQVTPKKKKNTCRLQKMKHFLKIEDYDNH